MGGGTPFRFQDLKIWRTARDLANQLFDLADELDGKGERPVVGGQLSVVREQ
jgi:hypothetical protein